MRSEADRERLDALLWALGLAVRAPHTLYLVGGTSAIVVGWRTATRDIDVVAEPDSDELLRALSELKDRWTSTWSSPRRSSAPRS